MTFESSIKNTLFGILLSHDWVFSIAAANAFICCLQNIVRQSINVQLRRYQDLEPLLYGLLNLQMILRFIFRSLSNVCCPTTSRFRMTVRELPLPAVYRILPATAAVAIQLFISTRRQVYSQHVGNKPSTDGCSTVVLWVDGFDGWNGIGSPGGDRYHLYTVLIMLKRIWIFLHGLYIYSSDSRKWHKLTCIL